MESHKNAFDILQNISMEDILSMLMADDCKVLRGAEKVVISDITSSEFTITIKVNTEKSS